MANTLDQTLFTCCECGEVLPITLLSRTTVRSANARSRKQALARTDHPVCTDCDEAAFVGDSPALDFVSGRTDRERFEFSGLTIDPARWTAHCLSY